MLAGKGPAELNPGGGDGPRCAIGPLVELPTAAPATCSG